MKTKKSTPRRRLPSLNARIRKRRAQLGLTGAELAHRAGISPSYVSLIEKGTKVPDEAVAARLARALQDEEDLYRAWARASRLGLHRINLLKRLDVISGSPAYLSMVERGEKIPAIEDDGEDGAGPPGEPAAAASPEWTGAGELAGRLQQVAERSPALGRLLREAQDGSPSEIIRVPVLADGSDPGKLAPSPLAVQDRLLVDRRLVGDYEPERLFAYEVTPRAMTHLRGLASPGDRIVFRRGGRVGSDRICVVRTPDGIVLSRVLFRDRSLLLLPGDGERDFQSVDVEGLKALPGVIAGTHVLVIRR
jgi:transcriptional regulator with XRE-family HTH domain